MGTKALLPLNAHRTLLPLLAFFFSYVHLKLRNTNLHNVTHSLIFQNPREQMSIVQISFLIVTFLSLVSRILSVMQTTQEVNHTPLAFCHVSICGVSPSCSYSSPSSFATCWMLVNAYATSPGKAKWLGPHHIIKVLHFVLFHNVTCYTNTITSHIHVNTTTLRNITCTFVATCMILRSLECIFFLSLYIYSISLDSAREHNIVTVVKGWCVKNNSL